MHFATTKIRLIIAGVVVAVIALITVLGGIIAALTMFGYTGGGSAVCEPVANNVPEATGPEREQQLANAKIIDDTTKSVGLSGQASRIAIITAISESSLLNINYDDDAMNPDGTIADGGGLFQQQPSQGWGTFEQVTDPVHATKSFLLGPAHDGSSGLVALAGWETMEPTAAIHAVQGNLDPLHYQKYYGQADEFIATLGIDVSRPPTGGQPGAPAGDIPVAGAGACAVPGGQVSGSLAMPLDLPMVMTDNYGPRLSPTAGASSWHAAVDLTSGGCGAPVYSILPGTVTRSDVLYLTITSPEGIAVSYLHMYSNERLVSVGAEVAQGQQIGGVGSVPPSTGCHLDVRIAPAETTNAQVAALPQSDSSTGFPGYVDPEEFYRLYGMELCGADCPRVYDN